MRKNVDYMDEAPKKKKMMGALKKQFTGPTGSDVHNESNFAGDEKSKTKNMDKDSRKKMAVMILKKKMG